MKILCKTTRRFWLSSCLTLFSASALAQEPPDPRYAEALSLVEASPAMQRAYGVLTEHREWVNAQMIAINEIPAPPFAEDVRAQDFAARLEATGVDSVVIDTTGNVIGRRHGTQGGRTIAVVAHLDTVFPAGTDVTVAHADGVYRAPGIGDNSRGAAMLLALSVALDASGMKLRDDVLLIGSIGEEGLGDLRGTRALFERGGPAIDAFIAIDGGDAQRLVTQAVGSNRYRVTFRGPGGHSYGQFGRANPHHALANAIGHFSDDAGVVAAAQGAKATYSVGRIGGGTSINAIAFESWMEVDMRSADPERLAALDASLQRAVDKALNAENNSRSKGAALTVSVDSVGRRPAATQPDSLPIIQRALAAQRLVGFTPALSASSTDANIPMSLGIPAITISRGGVSRNAHALNEYWEDRNTQQSEWFALLLIAAEAGLVN